MYNLNNLLPFLDKAPLIKKSRKIFKTEDVLIDPSWVNVYKKVSIPSNKVWEAYVVYPIGKIVIKASINEIMSYLVEGKTSLVCNAYEVDYSKVASVVSVSDGVAMYPYLQGYITEPVTDIKYILDSTGDYKVVVPEVLTSVDDYNVRPEPVLSESVSVDDIVNMISNSQDPVISVGSSGDSPYLARLESYFLGNYSTNRTPLLVGGTAVAKSSVVKDLCHKHNMRLVDIRTAFISRLDLEGLTEAVDLGDTIESFSCPMDQMVMCTDAYVDYCREAVKKINTRIEALKSSNDEKDNEEALILELKVLPKFVEGSKVPVLFFDEITRGEASVRQALTKILSDKAFMGYPMKYARFIAATNSTGQDDDIFLTKVADDSAFYDRFESMFITPIDAFPGWLDWASAPSTKHNGQNIHESIMEFISGSVDIAYNNTEIMQKYEDTQDLLEFTSSAFPNYRTWEMVSDYIYSNEDSKTYSLDYISGLIGNTTAVKFVYYLENQYGWSRKPNTKDKMKDVVGEGMDSGTPTMLIAPSSVGKTSRVKQAVKDRGALFIEVNLAEQDRTDLLGFPIQISINKMILGDDTDLPEDLKEELDLEISKYKLPQKVTTKAPKASVVEQFKTAYATGQDVVIFFDEINRVMNPSTMSVVFDACSDHRIFGVNFDPSRVKIFAACNLGDNMSDAQPLDPAFAARFSIYKKMQYDSEDVDAFLEYANNSEFDPILLQYLNNLSKDKLLDMISSVETRTLEVSASSTRALEDLSKFLKDTDNNSVFTGTVLFNTELDIQGCKQAIRHGSYNELVDIFNRINKKMDNWSAVNSKASLKITTDKGNEVITASNIRDLFKGCFALISDDTKPEDVKEKTLKNVLKMVYSLDAKVVLDRKQITSFFLGDNSIDFITFYNKISGTINSFLKIEDCACFDNIEPFISQIASTCRKITDFEHSAYQATCDLYKYFKETLPVDNYRKFIEEVLKVCINPDMKFAYIKRLVSDATYGDKALSLAESGDLKFSAKILNLTGYSVTESEIKEKINTANVGSPVLLV